VLDVKSPSAQIPAVESPTILEQNNQFCSKGQFLVMASIKVVWTGGTIDVG
jgi:hypothetical protein